MNKKILLSCGLIALLALYIMLTGKFKSGDIPELEWKKNPDEITISRVDSAIRVYKKDKKWLINKEAYPADKKTVDEMLKKFEELNIEDLISRQGFYTRYDLTPEKYTEVQVKKDGKTFRKVFFGKTGPTNRHTFIKVGDGPEVYLAAGVFDRVFNKKLEDLRDKVIIKADKKAVTAFDVTYRGTLFSFKKENVKAKADKKTEDKKDRAQAAEKDTGQWTCRGYESLNLNNAGVEQFLSSFDPLRASGYPDRTRNSLGTPLCRISIHAYDKVIDLSIFNKDKDNKYAALSSESPYVFTVDEWRAKKFFLENLNSFKEK